MRDATWWYSPRVGGRYSISGTVGEDRELRRLSSGEKARLTTWIVDQRSAGEQYPMVKSTVLEELPLLQPMPLATQRMRFFTYLRSCNFGFSGALKFAGTVDEQYWTDTGGVSAWCELQSERDLNGFAMYLSQAGLINQTPGGIVTLSAAGYEALDALSSSSTESTQAFVAMWFSTETREAYERGLKAGIERTGFRPIRIDVKEHNNKIDDEIVLEIRRSRFVVADFTAPTWADGGQTRAEARGGVYWEAGFAQGLGIPVVWTVRKDCLPYVHFDTRQYSHIVWENPEELSDKLYARIGATIGLL